MKKYNKDKRASYKAHTRSIKVYDERDGYDTHDTRIKIKIHIRYDGQRHTRYDKGVFTHKRQSKEQRYIGTINAINDIFPEINGTHNRHTYRANCEYHTFIPQETDYTRPIDIDDHTYKDMKRVKCIIYNRQDEIIHYGIFTRLITLNYITHETHITLHRADRQIEVHEYIPRTDTIHGITIKEIRAHDVEIYHI